MGAMLSPFNRRPAAAGGDSASGTPAPAQTQQPQWTGVPNQPTSQWQPYGNSPMVPNVQTSVQPTGVYTPQQTQQALNQQLASLSAQNNLRTLLHGTDTPGVSRSAGSIQQVLPQIAQARGQAAMATQMQPFSDTATNLSQLLAGQQAQGQEWFGLAGASNQMNQQALANQYGNAQWLLGLLGSLGAMGG